MIPRTDVAWKVYSLVTGFVADVAALALSAAVSEEVSATVGGIFITAAILELAPLGSDLVLKRSLSRMDTASTPEERGTHVLAALAALTFGAAWIVVGIAIADWLVPNFAIASFQAYIGTVALVWAATVAIYLPLHVARRWRGMRE